MSQPFIPQGCQIMDHNSLLIQQSQLWFGVHLSFVKLSLGTGFGEQRHDMMNGD